MCLLLGALSTAVAAADAPPLTVDLGKTAQLTVERSLTLKASHQAVDTARDVLREAKGYRYGRASLTGEYLHLNEAPSIPTPAVDLPIAANKVLHIALPPVEVAPQDIVRITAQAGYPLYTGGKIDAAIRAASAGVSARQSVALDTEASTILGSTQIYLGTLLTREVVHVQEDALASYQQHLAQAQKAFAAGVVARYDVIRAETAVKEQEKRLTEARNQYDLALAALHTALNLDAGTPLQVAGTLFEVNEPLTLAQAQEAALRDSHILKAQGFQSEALAQAAEVERDDGKPQVAAVSRLEFLTSTIPETDPGWFVGVEASLNFFNGGVRKARVAQRENERLVVETEQQSVADQIALGVQSAYLDMSAARSTLDAARKAVELARESLRLASRRFDVGTGTSLEVLDANVALSAAQVSANQALYQLDRAYLELHRYLGNISEVCREAQR